MTMNIVWSKPDCPQCDQAKRLLALRGVVFEERTVGQGWSREQLLESVPTARSVPQIFLDGAHVGGFAELQRYFEQGPA